MFRELVLEKKEIRGQWAVSDYVIANMQYDEWHDPALDRLIMQLRSYVWSDPERSHHKTWRFVEGPVYESWRHALVAKLPVDSYRRRFLCFFWDIPLDYAGKRITHTVEVNVPATFPECTTKYPPGLGRLHLPIHIDAHRATA